MGAFHNGAGGGAPGFSRATGRDSRNNDAKGHVGRSGAGDGARSLPGHGRERRGGALDPRLLRYATTTRRFVVLAVAVGGATALLVVAQAFLIATVVAGAFIDHRSAASLRTPLGGLLAVVAGRAALAWATERAAHRASASAKSELRLAATTPSPHSAHRASTAAAPVSSACS